MPSGGWRPGGGRPLGRKNDKTLAEEALSANESPLDFMLRKMRDPRVRPEQRIRMALAAVALLQAQLATEPTKKEPHSEPVQR